LFQGEYNQVFQEFLIARKSNHSNVYIVETLDPVFVKYFIESVMKAEDFKNQHDMLALSLQTSTLTKLKAPVTETQVNPLTVWGELLRKLRNEPTVLFILYLIRQTASLEDFLLASSHDSAIYSRKSTVIVFTSGLEIINVSVRKLIYEISVPLPGEEERFTVMKETASEILEEVRGKIPSEEVDEFKKRLEISPALVNESRGLTLFEIQTALLRSWTRKKQFDTEEFTVLKCEKLRSLGLDYIIPARGFESVGGYEYVKDYLSKRVVRLLKNPELAFEYGVRVPRGILLFGPPGTGKTWIAKALAKECGIPAVMVDASTFLRGIVGETEARVKQVIRVLEAISPVLVIIDEVDQLALAREGLVSTDSGVSRRLVNMLLSWLGDENRKSIVVGTTNHIKDIDPAFLRPGRFDELIPVLLPDVKSRLEILNVHTSGVRKIPLVDNAILEKVAEITHGYTAAELEKLVIEASFRALDEGEKVGMEHFQEAVQAIKPDVSARLEKVRKMLEEAQRLETGVNTDLIAQLTLSNADARVRGVVM